MNLADNDQHTDWCAIRGTSGNDFAVHHVGVTNGTYKDDTVVTALDAQKAAAVKEAAGRYTATGIHILPILIGTKKPDARVLDRGRWQPYQHRLPTQDELIAWFSLGGHEIGIVTGTEHNLLGIDIDVEEFKPFFKAMIKAEMPMLAAKLTRCAVIRTPSGGEHWYVRCEEALEGNLPLAYALIDIPADAERYTKEKGGQCARWDDKEYPVVVNAFGEEKARTIAIETRGEGGYAKTYPSIGYKLLGGNMANLPILSGDEVRQLYAIARKLNACPDSRHAKGRTEKHTHNNEHQETVVFPPRGTGRPGDDYNFHGDPLPLLIEADWSEVGRLGEVTYLCRPGKSSGTSASFGHCGERNLYVFSTNAYPFEANEVYSPFAIFAMLKHDGDYKAAAAALRADGWGGADRKEETVLNEADNDVDAVCATFAYTDLGNAERFAARWGNKLRWIDTERAWATWTGQFWERQETNSVALRAAALTARSIQDEAKQIAEDDFKVKLGKWGRTSESRGAMSAMVDCAKLSDPIRAKSSDFDRNHLLLSLENGTLDLSEKTRTLQSHDPAHLLTTFIPVAFDEQATAPLWEKFMVEVLPDEAVRNYVHKYMGYGLTGDTSDQTFLFFHGSGANGKGTFVDTMIELFGGLHVRIPECVITSGDSDSGAARFGLAPIVGKRLVTFGELESGKRLNESLLKDLTGQDPVFIERKNVDGYAVRPIAKYILIGNHKPSVRGDDNGIWRRVRLIPFTATFPVEKRDPQLRSKLRQELPGILNWLLSGYDAYQTEGLIPPAAVVAATDEYRSDSDTFGQFLEDRCEVASGNKSTGSELYTAYKDWAIANGQRFPLTNKSFASKLKDRGFETKKTKTSNLWLGLRVLPSWERERQEADD